MSRNLIVETTNVQGTPVVRVRGEVDLYTAPHLRERLLEFLKHHAGRLLVDLTGVGYMDSSGVGTLVFVKRVVERTGRGMVLFGLQPRVRSVFEITHLDAFFTIVKDLDQVDGK